MSRLPNSIGYVEYAYVKQNKMTYTQLKNRDGVYVSPSDDTFKAAAAGADWNKSFYQLITDQPGKDAWPISTATFILMHLKQDNPAKTAADLDYIPMPDSVVSAIEKVWSQVTDASGKPVALK